MSDKNAEALKKIKEKKEVKGTADEIQYADRILAAIEKWEKMKWLLLVDFCASYCHYFCNFCLTKVYHYVCSAVCCIES